MALILVSKANSYTFANIFKTQNLNNMKKLLLSLSLVAIAFISANAQVTFGVKAGLNLSTWTGSDASSTNFPGKAMKAGLNIGAQVAIPVSSNFSVQPEAVYSMQGVKVTGGTYELDYINIPVLAMYRFHGSNFSAGTGPQIGFLTTAKAKPSGGTSTDIKDQLQSTDFAWAFNFAYMTNMGLGFNARYNLGLSTIDKGTGGTKDKVNNSVIQLGAFWNFGPKGGKK